VNRGRQKSAPARLIPRRKHRAPSIDPITVIVDAQPAASSGIVQGTEKGTVPILARVRGLAALLLAGLRTSPRGRPPGSRRGGPRRGVVLRALRADALRHPAPRRRLDVVGRGGRALRAGRAPRGGSVLVLMRTSRLPQGHVAVVSRVVSAREIRVDHANWASGAAKGRAARDQPVMDVSPGQRLVAGAGLAARASTIGARRTTRATASSTRRVDGGAVTGRLSVGAATGCAGRGWCASAARRPSGVPRPCSLPNTGSHQEARIPSAGEEGPPVGAGHSRRGERGASSSPPGAVLGSPGVPKREELRWSW
jgi:hypothetical protein